MSHIFISYSRKNVKYAFSLKNRLQDEGFDVWIDNERLQVSNTWQAAIGDAIYGCGAFIVIMSPASQTSEWVQKELALAHNNKKAIFPLLLQGNEWQSSLILANVQHEDVRDKSLPSRDFFQTLEKVAHRDVRIRGSDVTPEEIRFEPSDNPTENVDDAWSPEEAASVGDDSKPKRDVITYQMPRMMLIVLLALIIAMTIVTVTSILASNLGFVAPATIQVRVRHAEGIFIWAAPLENMERPIIVYQGAVLVAHAKTEVDGRFWYLVVIPGRENEHGWVSGEDIYIGTGDEARLPDYDSFPDAPERFPIGQ